MRARGGPTRDTLRFIQSKTLSEPFEPTAESNPFADVLKRGVPDSPQRDGIVRQLQCWAEQFEKT